MEDYVKHSQDTKFKRYKWYAMKSLFPILTLVFSLPPPCSRIQCYHFSVYSFGVILCTHKQIYILCAYKQTCYFSPSYVQMLAYCTLLPLSFFINKAFEDYSISSILAFPHQYQELSCSLTYDKMFTLLILSEIQITPTPRDHFSSYWQNKMAFSAVRGI